jgi:hypothetical protein
LIAVFLDHAGRFVIAMRILPAQPVVADILECACTGVADLHAGIEKSVSIEIAAIY